MVQRRLIYKSFLFCILLSTSFLSFSQNSIAKKTKRSGKQLYSTTCWDVANCVSWFELHELQGTEECQKSKNCPSVLVGDPVPAPKYRSNVIVLRGIKFNSNEDAVDPSSYDILNRNISVLQNNPQIVIKIVGHTDSRGSRDYNYHLSLNRAKAVKDYLVKHKVYDDRIRIEARGESQPIATNNTARGRRLNRRIEIHYWYIATRP